MIIKQTEPVVAFKTLMPGDVFKMLDGTATWMKIDPIPTTGFGGIRRVLNVVSVEDGYVITFDDDDQVIQYPNATISLKGE